jgi:hypothetical protein
MSWLVMCCDVFGMLLYQPIVVTVDLSTRQDLCPLPSDSLKIRGRVPCGGKQAVLHVDFLQVCIATGTNTCGCQFVSLHV